MPHIEALLAEFNKKFAYRMGEPMEGSLVLNHNNVRDFLETAFASYTQTLRERVGKEIKLREHTATTPREAGIHEGLQLAETLIEDALLSDEK
jgi:hypothetical protein